MIGDILICFLLQIAFTVGLIILFGFLIALCNKRFYSNFGNYGRAVCYITGAIGTPLHECAHALFCVVFGHKITEIKLFQINLSDGTLGYVNHSYNPKNIYHKVGNFFIGVAPILVITAILYLIAWLLLPQMTAEIFLNISKISFTNGMWTTITDIFSSVEILFSYITNWQWWVFIIVGMFLALHMTLSGADIKGALSGLMFLLLILLIVDIALATIGGNILNNFTQRILGLSGYMVCFFALSLVIAVLALAISFIFRLLKNRKRF